MTHQSFEWDQEKNTVNQKAHDVTFEEAQYVFFDENRIIAHDEKHKQ